VRRLISILAACALVGIATVASATISMAAPHQGNPGTDFVCPVIPNAAVGEHNPVAGPLGSTGAYTVVPATSQASNMNVPDQATNMNGDGIPGGPQASPGDTDYTAIWNGQ
jgi:hypothetical protein